MSKVGISVRYAFLYFVRLLLAVFYRVEVRVEGGDLSTVRGAFVLPNHVALVDPVILVSRIWPQLKPRPVVSRTFHDRRILRPIMRLVNAFPMDSTSDGATEWKRRKIAETLHRVRQALTSGDNVLLYPSGELKQQQTESLGGKSGAYTLVQACPDAKIVLVRIRGLWGSVFSRYYTGTTPSLKDIVCTIATNPKLIIPRSVSVQIDVAVVEHPPVSSVAEFNAWLEDWYNAEPDTPRQHAPEHVVTASSEAVLPEGYRENPGVTRILEELAMQSGRDVADLNPSTTLVHGLGFDSLTVSTLPLLVEQITGNTVASQAELVTVGDVVRAALGEYVEVETDTGAILVPGLWRELVRKHPAFPVGAESLLDGFMRTKERMGGRGVACGDDRAGVLSYRDVNHKILLLARIIRDLPGDSIGLMLPSSVAGAVTALAVELAGKTLVPLNWTAGSVAVDHVIRETALEVILSSDTFLDHVGMDVSDSVYNKIVTLESFKASIGLRAFVAARSQTYRSREVQYRMFGYEPNRDRVAIVLATSGSSGPPKLVPLTHRNVLSNVEAAIAQIPPEDEHEVFLAFLPLFHSFGLTMTTMLPLVCGVKVVFDPDPKKSKHLVRNIEKWCVTRLAGTPTFVLNILNAAVDPERSFGGLRAFLVGAERTPDQLLEWGDRLGVLVISGYGLTETAPLLTATRPGKGDTGVGMPVGCEIRIIDLDTLTPVRDGVEGIVVARGDNVFGGYRGSTKDPFVEIDGARWFNTGDLGRIEPNGCLSLVGRKDRQIKFGGEKVGLDEIERILESVWQRTDNGPAIAVTAQQDKNGPPVVTLYTTVVAMPALYHINEMLHHAGLPTIAFIRRLVEVDEIPVLGTGKTNYQALPVPA